MIKPYGSNTLIDGYIKKNQEPIIDDLLAGNTPFITCDEDIITDCNRIADGSLTPVDGFFRENDLHSLIRNNKMENGNYFPIPILLQVPETIADPKLETLLLKDQNGNAFGFLENISFFKYDPKIICDYIFVSYDRNHPGVQKFLSQGSHFVGGKLKMIPTESPLSQYCISPLESRRKIKEHHWKSCVGFQTRNIPHRSHEYLQRIALEFFDGLLIHPIIGWKKTNDYRPEVIMEVYKYFVNTYYPKDRVILSGLEAQMRYAGPKEAVLHAIIRQNYGCSHFIVGRDHAGVNNYYEKYAAHGICDSVQKYLDISILKLKGPYYCKKCKCITTENSCGHDARYHVEISGTRIRDFLQSSRNPPATLIRKDITDTIRKCGDIFI